LGHLLELLATDAVEGELDGIFGILRDVELPGGAGRGVHDDLQGSEAVAHCRRGQDFARGGGRRHLAAGVDERELRIYRQRLRAERQQHQKQGGELHASHCTPLF
jgi:hypothetical protein